MKSVKLVVIYPRPKDVDAFEHVYQTEHVPLAVARLNGKTKMVATEVLASPQGTAPFYRFQRFTFPRCKPWRNALRRIGGKEALAHAVKISSSGPPSFLVGEEETFTFTKH